MADRIVSLAPSATRIIRSLGAGNCIVGQTEHGDGPGSVVGGWLTPDLDAIDRLDPDIVVTTDALQASIGEAVDDRGHATVHLAPGTLDEVLESIRSVGESIGRETEALTLVSDLESRIATVRDRVSGRPRPTVYCEEWQNPPMVAGNWVPHAVAAAGGDYPWLAAGERSRPIDRERVEAVDPDHVVLHICGSGSAVDPESVRERGWTLSAVDSGAITVLPDDYLNQPSPTLVDGIEQLAAILHPLGAGEMEGRSAK